MTWTYDRSTDVGKVRLLITGESVEATAVYEDEDILDVLLAIEGTVLGAAALGLERIAGDQALLLRKVRDSDPTADNTFGGVMDLAVGSIKLNAAGAADAFLKLAARYRTVDEQGTAGSEDDIGWAGMVLDQRSWSDAIWADVLRNEV
jgi:hypothetical protein